ncbi:hypothetical protein M6B38_221555 [Iris pallida]|uniref:Uncharacterized protein n=1 Tax=Iris pallida TaxID=29817 RepID=A0AAX6DWA3_IRIPA|nr:hypothetical protein M6B38_221555 [Iris pallida]
MQYYSRATKLRQVSERLHGAGDCLDIAAFYFIYFSGDCILEIYYCILFHLTGFVSG